MRRLTRAIRPTLACVLLGTVALLSGCSAGGPPSPTPSVLGHRVDVVTTTAGYASIVETVGGPAVSVTTLSTSPLTVHRSPTIDATDRSAVADAAVFVENGGGYDAFADSLLPAAAGTPASNTPASSTPASSAASPSASASDSAGGANSPIVIDASELAAAQSSARPRSSCVFYDIAAMRLVVGALVGALSESDPKDAAAFVGNGEKLTGQLNALARDESGLRAKVHGRTVGVTDRVAVDMLTAVGLVPRAVTAGSSMRGMAALVRNTQGSDTRATAQAAVRAGVRVADIRETLPASTTYVQWMGASLQAIAAATT